MSVPADISVEAGGLSLQLGADMFNAFNRSNLAAPSVTSIFINSGTPTAPNATYSPQAGQITSTLTSSRQFQLSARLAFEAKAVFAQHQSKWSTPGWKSARIQDLANSRTLQQKCQQIC